MTDLDEQLESALRAVAFRSATEYAWFDETSTPLPTTLAQAVEPEMRRSYVCRALTNQLYADFYVHGRALPRDDSRSRIPFAAGITPFVRSLSAANMSRGSWEDGWTLLETHEDRVLVERNAFRMSVPAHETFVTESGRVAIRIPKEHVSASPGFYMFGGDFPFPEEDPQLRIYWNLTSAAATRFVRELTVTLNAAPIAFRAKVMRSEAGFVRCDAGVLYLRRADYPPVVDRLAHIYRRLANGMNDRTPALTKRLAPGLGAGESPANGDSFGMDRCRMLADAMVRAHERQRFTLEERWTEVRERFAEEGISIAAPYLDPDSRAEYGFPRRRVARPRKRQSLGAVPPDFLATANAIGKTLIAGAVWSIERCNWVAPDWEEEVADSGRLVWRSLGPDLYSGLAGVALFLGDLHSVTGDADASQTALGAIRCALDNASRVPRAHRRALYCGWLGIALVAARLSRSLQSEDLRRRAQSLVMQAIAEPEEPVPYVDVMAGTAGFVAALLILQDLLDAPVLLEAAVRTGDALVKQAQKDPHGSSWSSPVRIGSGNLTGFAHGTAGIGWALLELWRATRDNRYRETARLAFEYERASFDQAAGRWMDLRALGGPRTTEFPVQWCHGAAGIGLSRAREIAADERTARPESLEELRAATAATVRQTEAMLSSPRADFCLCHGIAGQLEILSLTQDVAPHLVSAGFVQTAANRGAALYHSQGIWPCGLGVNEQTPSLMLGLSGIGRFYLRLHDRTLPSVLLFERDAWTGAQDAETQKSASEMRCSHSADDKTPRCSAS